MLRKIYNSDLQHLVKHILCSTYPGDCINICGDHLLITIIMDTGVFFHKTFRIYYVCCNFIQGYMCQITVICDTLKDESLFINTFASNSCYSYRNIFQNGADALLNKDDAFLKKAENFILFGLSDNV